jgi:hypothetical protein
MSEQPPPPSTGKNERIATLISPEPDIVRRPRIAVPLETPSAAGAAPRRLPMLGVAFGIAIVVIAAALYWLIRG